MDKADHRETVAREQPAPLLWIPILFTSLFGGPSLLAILQDVGLHGNFIAAFQWLVDAYRLFMSLLSNLVTPGVEWLIAQVRPWLPFDIHLDHSWRHVFALLLILRVAEFRASNTVYGDVPLGNPYLELAVHVVGIAGLALLWGLATPNLISSGLVAALMAVVISKMSSLVLTSARIGAVIFAVTGVAVFLYAPPVAAIAGLAAFAVYRGVVVAVQANNAIARTRRGDFSQLKREYGASRDPLTVASTLMEPLPADIKDGWLRFQRFRLLSSVAILGGILLAVSVVIANALVIALGGVALGS